MLHRWLPGSPHGLFVIASVYKSICSIVLASSAMPRKTADLTAWARLGAQTRLVELAAERRAILATFPDLRAATERPRKANGRTRRRLSSAQRQAVSERMKRYWAARKAGPIVGKPDRSSGSIVKRRTMSAAGRRRIAKAQRKRWAALKAKKSGNSKSAS